MQKLSSDKVAAVLAQVPETLRALAAERDSLKEKVAHYERQERARGIASQMMRKNLDPDTSEYEKVAHLMRPDVNLDVVEQAVVMSAQQVKVASLSDAPGNSSNPEGAFWAGLGAE